MTAVEACPEDGGELELVEWEEPSLDEERVERWRAVFCRCGWSKLIEVEAQA